MFFRASESLVFIDSTRESHLSMSQISPLNTCSKNRIDVKAHRDIEKIKFYLIIPYETLTFVIHSDDECPPLVTFPPTYFY